MKTQFRIGDQVKHKKGVINGGLEMYVDDIRQKTNGDLVIKLSHFKSLEGIFQAEWFDANDFEVF